MYGAANPWSRAAVIDVFRHMYFYNLPTIGQFTSHQNYLNAYQGASIPPLIVYEGGFATKYRQSAWRQGRTLPATTSVTPWATTDSTIPLTTTRANGSAHLFTDDR